jgi:hypothetical protein
MCKDMNMGVRGRNSYMESSETMVYDVRWEGDNITVMRRPLVV